MLRKRTASRKAGNSLVTAMIMVLALAAILTAAFQLTTSEYLKSRRWRDETRSFYIAEAGANEALATLVLDGKDELLALASAR